MTECRPLLLGFDLGGTKLALALARADGAIETTATLPTRPEEGAESALDRALEAARAFLADQNARARAVGVSTMGITHEDHVELAPNVTQMAKLLLENKANVNAPDKTSATPLHRAAGADEVNLVQLLLSHKADTAARDKEGRTPLTWAEGVFLATHPAQPKRSSVTLIKTLLGL